jgi:hypothetical protein
MLKQWVKQFFKKGERVGNEDDLSCFPISWSDGRGALGQNEVADLAAFFRCSRFKVSM